ncbi:MAG: alpha/beta fold hydrolase [Betaproteobacteria bacterium]|nr:alpha/beta fold hydrolase [Betaproteobacteria bacterium]
MIETAQQFGPGARLVGVLTRPETQPETRPETRPEGPASPKLAWLLFNAGVIGRVGAHRINVKLARQLAQRGEVVLRFDLSGRGDSRFALQDAQPEEQSVRDLQAAMDHLERTLGIRQFAVIGFCSGAMDAYWTGLADTRIRAMLMFDGFWYRTRWTMPIRNLKRLLGSPPQATWRAARRRVQDLARVERADSEPATTLFSPGNNPARDEFAGAMQQFADRGVAVRLVYSGSVLDYYSYGAQFRQVFRGEPWLGRVRCDYRPDIDHMFLTLDTQRRISELVVDWLPEVRSACSHAG